MDVYTAKDKLWEEIKHIFGIYGAGIGLCNGRECIVVWGRPLALRKIPNTYQGYKVIKKIIFLPFGPSQKLDKIPRPALKMAEKISKLTNLPLEQVLRSEPVRKYIKKIREEDYVLY